MAYFIILRTYNTVKICDVNDSLDFKSDFSFRKVPTDHIWLSIDIKIELGEIYIIETLPQLLKTDATVS